MMNYKIRIGTRGSNLALIQALEVSEMLKNIGFDTEIIKIKTEGDIDQRPLYMTREFGIFTKKINEELLNENIDIAVHSMKDLPVKIEEGLKIVSVLKRERYEDFFLSNKNIFEIEEGKKIGTSSLRRKSFLKIIRPDIEIVDVRGNIDTRIKKYENKEVDGLILAYAGIKRLNLNPIGHILDPDLFVPQANQGIIAILSRNDFHLNEKISLINHKETFLIGMVEKEFLRELDAGCHSPVGVLARLIDGKILIHVAYIDDKRYDYWSKFEIKYLDEELKRFRRWYDAR